MTRVGPLLSRLLTPRRVAAGWWFAFGAALAALDYATGPDVQIAATYAVPVFLAAWYSGLAAAATLAVLLPLSHVILVAAVWDAAWDPVATAVTGVLRASVLTFLAVMIARIAEHEHDLEREVEVLHHLKPICVHCKRVRNEAGEWESWDDYVASHPEATFTRGLCPRCAEAQAPDYFERAGTTRE